MTNKRLISLFLVVAIVMLPVSISLASQCHSDSRNQLSHQHSQKSVHADVAEQAIQLTNTDVLNDHSHTFSHDCVSCNTLPVSTTDVTPVVADELPQFFLMSYTPASLALDKRPPKNIL